MQILAKDAALNLVVALDRCGHDSLRDAHGREIRGRGGGGGGRGRESGLVVGCRALGVASLADASARKADEACAKSFTETRLTVVNSLKTLLLIAGASRDPRLL